MRRRSLALTSASVARLILMPLLAVVFGLAFVAKSESQLTLWQVQSSANWSGYGSARGGIAVSPLGESYLLTIQPAQAPTYTILARHAANGTLIWERQLAIGYGYGRMACDEAGNLLISGVINQSDYFLEKLDATTGLRSWIFSTPITDPWRQIPVFAYDPLTSSIVFLGSHGNVYRIDAATGLEQWHESYPIRPGFSADNSQIRDLRIGSSGNIYVLGNTLGIVTGESLTRRETLFSCLTSAGAPVFQRSLLGQPDEDDGLFAARFDYSLSQTGRAFVSHYHWQYSFKDQARRIWDPAGNITHAWDLHNGLDDSWNGTWAGDLLLTQNESQVPMQMRRPDWTVTYAMPQQGWPFAELDDSKAFLQVENSDSAKHVTKYDLMTGRPLWRRSNSNHTYVNEARVAEPYVFLGGKLTLASNKGGLVKVAQSKLVFPNEILPVSRSFSATLDLGGPAPSGGLTFTLSSNKTSLVVPANVQIPEFASSVQFNVTTGYVAANTDVTVTATSGGLRTYGYVTVSPVRTLTVKSQNPNSGVVLTPTVDVDGNAQGTTTFTRSYVTGAHVNISVGSGVLAGNKLFDHFEKDGAAYAPPLIMDTNHTMTAVYVQGYVLSIQSSNPSAGVGITVWTADYYNRKNGSTPFSRLYKSGQLVSLTAPAQVGNQWFERWEKDGLPVAGGSKTMSVSMDATHVVRAVYVTGRTLTVSSANPDSGVPITVYQADKMGQKNGTTQFTRTYGHGATVALTAPATAGGATFVRWDKEGTAQPPGVRTISVSMIGNRSVKAVYAP